MITIPQNRNRVAAEHRHSQRQRRYKTEYEENNGFINVRVEAQSWPPRIDGVRSTKVQQD